MSMTWTVVSSRARETGWVTLASCAVLCVGCSSESDSGGSKESATALLENGGGKENPDRDQVENYFGALRAVQTDEDEAELLREFGNWLRERDYRILVEKRDGVNILSCPYFPPVTPWTEYSFRSRKNLDLLPHYEAT